MNDLLFNMPESKSPRLLWIEKHQVRTHLQELMREEGSPWSAWLPTQDWDESHSGCYSPIHEDEVGFGVTKDEAIIDLAKKNNLKLWNEEP